jgi:predicted nucleic acid-binding protein
MRCVLDSNVGIKWLLQEDLSDKARVVRDEFLLGRHELLAPDIFMVEAAHAVTRAQRQGRVLPNEVKVFIDDLIATAPDFHPHAPLLSRAIEISVQARHNVYDCLYVALAEREGCELLTADQKMINNLQGAFPLIVALASLP